MALATTEDVTTTFLIELNVYGLVHSDGRQMSMVRCGYETTAPLLGVLCLIGIAS